MLGCVGWGAAGRVLALYNWPWVLMHGRALLGCVCSTLGDRTGLLESLSPEGVRRGGDFPGVLLQWKAQSLLHGGQF